MYVIPYRWKHGTFYFPFDREDAARRFMARVGMIEV
jgi:hypothetical protein